MKIISVNESIIEGSWIKNGVQVLADENCKRIEWLISKVLHKFGMDKSGWEILYQDPKDKRYWVLSYPKSELQGGGPPTLKSISSLEEKSKFNGSENT